MNGKDKCKILKELRAEIARNNDIEWVVSECKHQGDCLGTCPKCEAELVQLEKELERRRNLGHTVTIAGLSFMLAGCSFGSIFGGNQLEGSVPNPNVQELDGEIENETGEVEEQPGEDDGEEIEQLAGDVADIVKVE